VRDVELIAELILEQRRRGRPGVPALRRHTPKP